MSKLEYILALAAKMEVTLTEKEKRQALSNYKLDCLELGKQNAKRELRIMLAALKMDKQFST